jgi:hypothetical protein
VPANRTDLGCARDHQHTIVLLCQQASFSTPPFTALDAIQSIIEYGNYLESTYSNAFTWDSGPGAALSSFERQLLPRNARLLGLYNGLMVNSRKKSFVFVLIAH